MRKNLIAGNWKMNKTSKEVAVFVEQFKQLVSSSSDDIVICSSFVSLTQLICDFKDSSVCIGAQNIHDKENGAYTGEVSAPMLADIGVSYVVLGHSERRQYFNETDDFINKKILTALKYKLKPILCVGELLEEREGNRQDEVVRLQLANSLKNLKEEDILNITIAYEPVWAIGTGKTASPDEAQQMHAFIRSWLLSSFGVDIASSTRLLYGGSVKPNNIKDLLVKKDIDGALVGGASLNADDFASLINR